MLYKRMEKEKFRFPKHISDEVYSIKKEELSWLMHGLRVEEIKRYEAMKQKFSTV